MTTWLAPWVALPIVALVGCGQSHAGGDAGSASDATVVGAYAGAYVARECGPDDGPALRLTLWDAAVPECGADPDRRSLDVYLHDGASSVFPIEAGETVTSTVAASNGTATECPGGTPPCRSTQDWSITFTTFVQGSRAAGTYRVTFADGAGATGSFDATWCEPVPPLCG